MAALAINLVEYSDSTNARTFTLPGHTVQKPRLVIQKRVVGTTEGKLATDTIDVVYGTADASGQLLPGRDVFSVSFRRPLNGIAADVDAALADFRAIVASDEFAAMVKTQNYLR